MSAESVVFGRIEARERQYIHFFSAMIQDLTANGNRKRFGDRNPRGTSWHTFESANIDDKVIGRFNVAFGFNDRVRVELHIDTLDGVRNGEILAKLRCRLEAKQDLIWSPIKDARACRVHLEREGNIRVSEDELATLRRQLTTDLVEFVDLFEAELARLAGEDQ